MEVGPRLSVQIAVGVALGFGALAAVPIAAALRIVAVEVVAPAVQAAERRME
jgi:hypothetical protein